MVCFLAEALLLLAAVGWTSAAPAIVWTSSHGPTPSHISESIDTKSLLSTVTDTDSTSALSAVIFLVGREASGSVGLISLASRGELPGAQNKYKSANEVYYNVEGVESARTVVRDARRNNQNSVAEVTMDEFKSKLSTMAQTSTDETSDKISKSEQKRRKAISQANVLVVNIQPTIDASSIDSAIVNAIDSPAVRNVVLLSIRSVDEVKRDRKRAVLNKFTKSSVTRGNRRRLEDEAQNEGDNNNNDDQEGLYYVNMTPNIFAGLLFTFMFLFTAQLGLNCMNMIEGQDVYVKKMPHIGREV